MRLQKFLAAAGFGSRRNCEEYITTGRVEIDGEIATELGIRVFPGQKIRVDGEAVRLQPKRHYLLNKPPGYLCTHRDPQGRPRAIDLLPQDGVRLFTVGRLDENSHGLLIVTNDGELGNRLAHPRYRVERTYRVQVAGRPTRETLQQLLKGIHFAEGRFRARRIRPVKQQGKSTFLEMTLTEGQNREIRRLFAKVGHKVMDLQRIAFGPVELSGVGPGEYRPLKPRELKALRDLVRDKESSSPKRGRKPSGPRRGNR